eukprot:12913561-Prorocentrum_lima.AAC.1
MDAGQQQGQQQPPIQSEVQIPQDQYTWLHPVKGALGQGEAPTGRTPQVVYPPGFTGSTQLQTQQNMLPG